MVGFGSAGTALGCVPGRHRAKKKQPPRKIPQSAVKVPQMRTGGSRHPFEQSRSVGYCDWIGRYTLKDCASSGVPGALVNSS